MKFEISEVYIGNGTTCNFCKLVSTKETRLEMVNVNHLHVCKNCALLIAEKFEEKVEAA